MRARRQVLQNAALSPDGDTLRVRGLAESTRVALTQSMPRRPEIRRRVRVGAADTERTPRTVGKDGLGVWAGRPTPGATASSPSSRAPCVRTCLHVHDEAAEQHDRPRPARGPGAGSARSACDVWREILDEVARAGRNRLCSCPSGAGRVSSWSQRRVPRSGTRPCSCQSHASSSRSFSHPGEQAGRSLRDSFTRASASDRR